MNARSVVLAAAALFAMGVAGCGGASGPTVQVTANNAEGSDTYRFAPDAVSIQQGSTIQLTNAGDVEHNLTVDSQNVVIYAGVGQSSSAQISLPPGSYTFQCTIVEAGKTHGSQGRKGTLVVTGKP